MKRSDLIVIMAVFLMLIIDNQVFGQKAEIALASIDYEFVHVNDTNNRDKPSKREMRVYLGQESSQYVDQAQAMSRERMEAILLEQGISIGGTNGATFRIRRSSGGSGREELFLYPAQRKLIMVDGIADTEYLIEQDFPQLDWEIGEETREIEGYHVQVARTTFGGRNYIAWFAPDLPFAFGPWKLHGLPGLILEARDESDEVQFNFKDFGRLDESHYQIALPEKGVKATPNQFVRAKAAYDNNPAAARQSNLPAGTVTERRDIVVFNDRDGNRRTLTGDEARAELERRQLQQANSNNNPLERETKKKN